MITDAAEAGHVLVALLCSGIFWTIVWFTVDRRPTWRFWPPIAAVLMVLAVLLFSTLISPETAAAVAAGR